MFFFLITYLSPLQLVLEENAQFTNVLTLELYLPLEEKYTIIFQLSIWEIPMNKQRIPNLVSDLTVSIDSS